MNFTPNVRDAIYGVAVAVFGLLVILGIVTETVSDSVLTVISSVLGALVAILAKRNVTYGSSDITPQVFDEDEIG